MAMNKKPKGSTLLNMITDTKKDCLDGDCGSTEIGGPKKDTTDTVIPVIPIKTDTPETAPVLPPSTDVNTSGQWPYSMQQTNAATCAELGNMIADTRFVLSNMKGLTDPARSSHEEWLSYAESLYAGNCKVVGTPVVDDPVSPPTIPQAPDTTPTPTVENPPQVTGGQVPIAEPDENPTVDNPDVIKTLMPPVVMPYMVSSPSGGSGGGGGESDEQTWPETFKKWFWPVVAAVAVVGFTVYNPKTIQ